jgi:hypothetical protein
VLFNHTIIADSQEARYVWEHSKYPQYYFPEADVQMKYLLKGKSLDHHHTVFLTSLDVNGRLLESTLTFEKGPLAGLVRFNFHDMGSSE